MIWFIIAFRSCLFNPKKLIETKQDITETLIVINNLTMPSGNNHTQVAGKTNAKVETKITLKNTFLK